MNLREEKGYTYGAGSSIDAPRFRGTWVASTNVRTEVTEPALTDLLDELRQARELDPLSPVILTSLGLPRFYARRYDEAVAAFERALAERWTVERREPLEPALVVLVQPALVVVDEDRRGDVHGVDQAQALPDAAFTQRRLHLRDVRPEAEGDRRQVRRHLDATAAGDPAKMYINFASGSSLFAQPQHVAGGALGVQGVNPFLLIYLGEGHDLDRTGAIMLDFPGAGLIDKIISAN